MATIPTAPPPQIQRQLATRMHGTRIALLLLLILGGAIAGVVVLLRTQGKPLAAAAIPAPTGRPWLKQAETYPEPEKPVEKPPVQPVDTVSPELARLRNELLAMQRRLEEMEKRKPPPAVVPPQPSAPTHGTPPAKRPAPTLHYHKESQDRDTSASKGREYILAPTTFLPCVVETTVNSDVEGPLTARVTQNVYDTATRHHLLVPQGSSILGHSQSSTLIYGNERLPTISLSLTLPSGQTVDLGNAPITDQEGVTGLGGRVDNHYWRLFGAVFIGGALRGGTQAVQMGVSGAGPAGSVIGGIAQQGGQVSQTVTGRALDARPTIHVAAGQLCHVLLTKPLHLPALWE